MTVHFEFDLSDEDAANLVGLLVDAKNEAAFNAFVGRRADGAESDWFQKHAKYLEKLTDTVVAGSSRK